MSTTQLFRVGLIVLLVLGMLIRPTLNQIGEIHGLEHRFQTSADSQINISVDKPSEPPRGGSIHRQLNRAGNCPITYMRHAHGFTAIEVQPERTIQAPFLGETLPRRYTSCVDETNASTENS